MPEQVRGPTRKAMMCLRKCAVWVRHTCRTCTTRPCPWAASHGCNDACEKHVHACRIHCATHETAAKRICPCPTRRMAAPAHGFQAKYEQRLANFGRNRRNLVESRPSSVASLEFESSPNRIVPRTTEVTKARQKCPEADRAVSRGAGGGVTACKKMRSWSEQICRSGSENW